MNSVIRGWWSEPHSAPGLIFTDSIELPHLRHQHGPPIKYLVSADSLLKSFSYPSCWCALPGHNSLTLIPPLTELFTLVETFGEGNGTPLQYSCLENPMDGEAWWAAVHGVVKSWTRLSDFPFTFHFHALEKEMATYSNVLAWRIPGTAEAGGLPSLGSQSRTRLKRLSSSSSSGDFKSYTLSLLSYPSSPIFPPFL